LINPFARSPLRITVARAASDADIAAGRHEV
jgi:hypothetical protein